MRATIALSLLAAVAYLSNSPFAAAGPVDVDAVEERAEGVQHPTRSEKLIGELAARAQVTPLAVRQLGGGAGGTDTTQTTLQSISGYTPPASSVLAPPTVASGTIVATQDIPGFNSSSSGAEMLYQPAQFVFAAAGGVAAGAAYLLF